MLENSAKEALIGITDWYEGVNKRGQITIDDMARLKIFVDLSKDILDTYKHAQGISKAEADYCSHQHPLDIGDDYGEYLSDDWGDDEIPF